MNSKSYVSYLFKKIKNLTFANPGVTRATYGTGENVLTKCWEMVDCRCEE